MPSKPVQWTILTLLAAFWLVTGSQSLLVSPINISRDQYETALAKWNSLHVTEYEETVSSLWGHKSEGKWKAIVHVDLTAGDGVGRVTHVESLDDAGAANQDLMFPPYGQFMTVYGLFDFVDNLLQGQSGSYVDFDGRPMRWYIQFDPIMGYPRSILSISKDTNSGEENYLKEWRMENVKVLK